MDSQLVARLLALARQHDPSDADANTWAALGRSLYKELGPLLALPVTLPVRLPSLNEWLCEVDVNVHLTKKEGQVRAELYTRRRCDQQQVDSVEMMCDSLPQLAALLKTPKPKPQKGFKQEQRWKELLKAAKACVEGHGYERPRPDAFTSESALARWLADLGLTAEQQHLVFRVARTVAELVALNESDLAAALSAPRPAGNAPPGRNWGLRALLDQARADVRSTDGRSLNEVDADVDGQRFRDATTKKELSYGGSEHVARWLTARGFHATHIKQVQAVAADLSKLATLDAERLDDVIKLEAARRRLEPCPHRRRLSFPHPFPILSARSLSAPSAASRMRFALPNDACFRNFRNPLPRLQGLRRG